MMNVENDDVEPVTDLQLSLTQFHQFNPTRLSNSGAGVNAASRVDLAFVASDPLYELVWSPHYGLSLKCADSSFVETKPSRFWNATGLSHMALSPPQGISSGGTSCDKHPTDDRNLISSQMAVHVEGKVGEGASFVRSPRSISHVKREFGASHGHNEGISDNMMVQKVENTDWKDKCSLDNIQANFTSETRENNAGQEKQITAFSPLKTDELKHGMAQTEPLSSSEQNVEVRMTDPSSRNEDFSLVNAEQNRNEMKKDVFSSELPPGKLEFRAENDLQFLTGKQVLSEASPTNSGTCLDRRKRKEKAFSDGHVNERMSNNEENSHESVESCNSAGPARLFSNRNEQKQLTVGNKRAKKQVQVREGLGSTSFSRQDSSFMNWISNMVRGLNKTNQEAPSLALTPAHKNHGPKSTNVGFQTIFQSMCCSNTKEQQETKMSNSTKTLSVHIVADPETCRTSSCSDQNRASFNLASNTVKEGSENIDSKPPAEAQLISPLRSFWITRFSPKTPAPMLNSNTSDRNVNAALECSMDYARKLIPSSCNLIDQKSSEAKENSTEDLVSFTGKELQKFVPDTETSFGFKRVSGNNAQKSTFNSNPSISSPKLKNSEAIIASVFARKLDALKHIVPPDVEDNSILKVATCFYCGSSGHILCECLEITEIERENLMRNKCSYPGAEESPCFCIRCFQLDHWAISCPVASLTTHNHSRVPDARTNCDWENYGPDTNKHVGSSSVDNALKEKLITPLCNLVKGKFSEVPKGVFNAIRKLRLTRTDILKWMNSHTSSLYLDGFFLRLRLGKWEEGLGGTGYHVACITGEQREKSPQGSKKPISVNIGGIRCLVETQYISNQDFLEGLHHSMVQWWSVLDLLSIINLLDVFSSKDELMAWWCATLKSGGKVPSEDHLESKLEDRERLGF